MERVLHDSQWFSILFSSDFEVVIRKGKVEESFPTILPFFIAISRVVKV